jgi:predicted flavoprotein YhiN
MKAAPLLRAWLHRLRGRGVRLHMRHRWQGWDDDGALRLRHAAGPCSAVTADATVLALGGASWQRLGSDGAWVPLLAARGVALAPLQPSNCGFDVAWSEHLPAATPARR